MSAPATPEPIGPGVAAAAVSIGIGNVASRLLGLVREQVIAALFGSTGPTSAFRTATRVSTAVYDLLLSGATTSALVPVFSDYAAAGKNGELSRIVSSFINLTVVGLGAVVGALLLGAPWLVSLLGADPDYFNLAVDLTRIALPSILLLGIAGILTSVLYARQAFRLPAFAPAVYNLGIIVAAITLAGPLSIYGLTLGLAFGALVQVLVQLPAYRGLRYVPVIDLGHPGVRLILRLYAPVFLGMLASYAVVVIDTNLAWRTGAESVADLAFATTLVQFPIGLVGAAASLAILPSLSRLAASGRVEDEAAFVETLIAGLKMVLLLMAPLAVALVMMREPVVALLFERRAFDAAATARTSLALLAYAPQLPFVVVDQLLIVAFYARKQTTTPVLVGVGGAALYLAVALSLITPMGMPGLALANAVQNSAHAVVLYSLLARRYPRLRDTALLGFAVRLIVGGIAVAIAVAVATSLLDGLLADPRELQRLLGLLLAALAAAVTYGACLTALRVAEVGHVLALLRRRWRR